LKRRRRDKVNRQKAKSAANQTGNETFGDFLKLVDLSLNNYPTNIAILPDSELAYDFDISCFET